MNPSRHQALEALFDAHYVALCRLATVLLDDPGVAEEAVQEAFLRTFVGWRRIRHPERAHAYLRAAVVNQCRSRGRRRAPERRGNAAAWSAAQAAAAPTDPAVEAERAGDAFEVLAAIRELPDRQREALVLRYYGDLSEADVAAALGCSVGTVKSQLSKARANLSRRLVERIDRGPEAPAPATSSGAVDG